MEDEDQIKDLVRLINIARILAGDPQAYPALSERDTLTLADLVLSGWRPLVAAEFIRLNFPTIL